jgi:serine O-acetyltransferase
VGRGAFHYDLDKYSYVLYRTIAPGIFRTAGLLLSNMGLQCIAVYRYGQMAKRVQKRHRGVGHMLRAIHLLMDFLVVLIHKVDISAATEIGPGFHISHAANIFIGARKIGRNCTVTHNVTIGHDFEPSGNDYSTIGDDVWIGTGAVVAGDITIGDGVAISAGSIVTRSIPDKCLVAGNPARVVRREYDNSRMLIYRMQDKSTMEAGPQEPISRREENLAYRHGRAET